ncbi:MAG TPA: glutamine amidotransferase [Patescibacteria group bacterium]|nr:glutamine amidotransferase [Patescibacteria group bacterium]
MIRFTYMPEFKWLLISATLSAAAVVLSYTWAKGKASRWLRIGLASLRWIIITALVMCLLDPQWIEAIKHQQQSRLAVLLDTSRSMGIKDIPQGRLPAAKQWLDAQFGKSPGNIDVEFYTFDQALARLPSLGTAAAKGDASGLGDALQGVLAMPSDDPLVGVVICSDGIENVRRDPEAVARLYHRKGIPIHALTVGTTNDVQDIIIENVQVKRAVPNQAPTRIGVAIRSAGYQGLSVPVQIFHANKLITSQSVKLKDGSQRVELDFTPKERGFQVYEVKIPSQAGEWLATNNRRIFGLEVLDPTIRVIYMEGTPQQASSPMPEWKYLKDALESDKNIKVKTLYRQFGNSGQFLNTIDADPETGEQIYPVEHPTRGFPRTLPELLNYDVIIHSDIRTDSFTAEQLQNMARLVEEFGGGFVMIGGNSAFGKGGYHRTILDRIIPVAMEQDNDSLARPITMKVPQLALNHPVMAIGSTREETEEIWTEKFPRLYGCNLVDRAKPGAVVLGVDTAARNQYGARLLLAVQNIGKGRSMAFTSDTTRSWGRDFETIWGEPINPALPLTERNCDSRYYRQFWVNAVRWLAAGRIGKTNNPVVLELAESYCSIGERVAASIKVAGNDLAPVAGADVTLCLSTTGQTNVYIKAGYDRVSQCYEADLAPAHDGTFTVTAAASLNKKKLGEDRQLLVCESGDREMADLRARPDLMGELSRISGGQTLTLAGDSSQVSKVFGTPVPASVEYHHTPLWDKWWWLGIILLLLTIEWSVRRLTGMA